MTIHQPLVRLSENGETLPGGRVRAPLPLPSDGEQKSSAMPLTTPPCILLGLRRNSKDHTAEEWEGIRPRFTELYLSKGMRLADVSQILRDHHGFHATDKQYKDRIRKWKIRKNFRDKEKREALVTGVEMQNGAKVAIEGSTIPQRRLKRFARDAKLLYVRRVAAAGSIPAEPSLEYDIVLDLSRSMFDNECAGDDRRLYNAFEGIDRLARQRTPVLAFEVIGVTDNFVRYGLRRLERKSLSGLAFEMTRPQGRQSDAKESLGIRWCASLKTLGSAHDVSETDDKYAALYHTINQGVYKACQYIYCPQSNPHNQALYRERRTVYRPALNPFNRLTIPPGQSPEVRCVQYNASAQAAQALYLRVMAQSLLFGGIRAGFNLPDAEFLSQPHLGIACRVSISAKKDFVVALQPPLNVAVHMIKRGDLLAGAIQFRDGYEGQALFMEGRLERGRQNLHSCLSAASEGRYPGSETESLLDPQLAANRSESFLTDGDLVESEFREAHERAAVKSAMAAVTSAHTESALISRPMTEADELTVAGRTFSRLMAEGILLDRAEPWKRKVATQRSRFAAS